ncbi:hypothetical protein ADUPG1_008834 [Aduncisulcus paluster]|uniref:Uncharacterized protein n=1 Tax=Aduncisulcus paluster TaxID=2918883 RepID=A0ABQ5KTF3_9EUKA|nr:hypothetical protein ADUPG1_008834 [Aduncisulcus paluster]
MSKLSFATLYFRLLLFLRCKQYKTYYPDSFPLSMSSSTDIQIVEPEFIHEGHGGCCPIPRDAPNIKSSEIPNIAAINETKEEFDEESYQSEEDDEEFDQSEEYDEEFDQSVEAQDLMRGEFNNGKFTHISIPFSSSSQMKGAFICLNSDWYHPEYLIFTLTSSKGDKISKKYEFPEFEGWHWYFLPVDLPDVVLCEITGKGRERRYFSIQSLVFIRQETPEEIKSREAREKLWSEAPVVKVEFVKKGGRKSIPIPRDDPKLVDPSFSMVKCNDDSVSKESEDYDQSLRAQRMLKGECGLWLSHLSIPFPSPSPMKGAYICVQKDNCSPSLLFTFTDCDGKKTVKKYEFTKPEHVFEWHFLPIDLDNVVLCEIEGKGQWNEKNKKIYSLRKSDFIRSDPSNIFSSLLKTVLGRLLNAPSFRMLLADRYGYLCPGISETEKCSYCGSQLDFISSTNHSRVCRGIRPNITGRQDNISSLSAVWLEEVLGLPVTREDSRFLRHLNTRTQKADIVAHVFGTSDWSRNLVFDAQITEAISTDIILDFTRKIVAIGNSVTAIVELGRDTIHACLTQKEAVKRSNYTPHPPPGSEINPRYSFDFYPMIFSSTGVIGESFQEFLALVQRHHSSRCIEELKVVLARSLAYGNALNRQSYELRCSGHATSETIHNHCLLFPFTHRSLYRSAAHAPPTPFSESMSLSLTSPTLMCQLSSKLR